MKVQKYFDSHHKQFTDNNCFHFIRFFSTFSNLNSEQMIKYKKNATYIYWSFQIQQLPYATSSLVQIWCKSINRLPLLYSRSSRFTFFADWEAAYIALVTFRNSKASLMSQKRLWRLTKYIILCHLKHYSFVVTKCTK